MAGKKLPTPTIKYSGPDAPDEAILYFLYADIFQRVVQQIALPSTKLNK